MRGAQHECKRATNPTNMTIDDENFVSRSRLEFGTQRAGLIDVLPFNIVNNVFSYLDQRDYLTCMATCRRGYSKVPQYAKAVVWKTVQFTTRDMCQNNKNNHRVRCLGTHVKKAIFKAFKKEDELYNVMRKVFNEWGCIEIESIENVRGPDWSSFFAPLCMTQLRSLTLTDITWNDPAVLFTMLNHCPCIEDMVVKVKDASLLPLSVELSEVELLCNPLRQLHMLELSFFGFRDERASIAFLERVPALEELTMDYSLMATSSIAAIQR
ncbi:hypothetical protein BDB00DRAFT_903843 [Zychaea mexicana]|uniref:uncharacterized protein n=1 Tax=Zychaea mexicana TaxID=64656 RepID=UPI0022FEE550|nr:uncharacterized protein BDB00DRAFT_903843 [Zychaea mexicana]KAI9494287.1 hypothetical protein BDB00DRAFT_903843 [Zychaea mexicana]